MCLQLVRATLGRTGSVLRQEVHAESSGLDLRVTETSLRILVQNIPSPPHSCEVGSPTASEVACDLLASETPRRVGYPARVCWRDTLHHPVHNVAED